MEKFAAFINDLITQVVDQRLDDFRTKIRKAYRFHVGLLSILMFLTSFLASYLVFGIDSIPSINFEITKDSLVYFALSLVALFTALNFFILRKSQPEVEDSHDFIDMVESISEFAKAIVESYNNEKTSLLEEENKLLREELEILKQKSSHSSDNSNNNNHNKEETNQIIDDE